MEGQNFKLIPLKIRGVETGEYAKCSIQDFDILNKLKWYRGKNYAKTSYQGRTIEMHAYIMNIIQNLPTPEGYIIDHVNVNDPLNKLNNCRENLRFLTFADNSRNRCKRKNTSSKYHGVSFHKKNRKYHSSLKFDGKSFNFGYFENEEEAAVAYDIYVYNNNITKPLNFDDKKEYYKTCIPIIKKRKNKKGYIGVYKHRNRFCVNVKQKVVFYSKDELTCAKEYDKYIIQNGFDLKLNFPDEHPNYVPKKIIKTFKEDIDDKICKIKLYGGKETIISLESYDKIKYNLLTCFKYVNIDVGKTGEQKRYLLHRYLLDVFDSNLKVDHIDGDTFNNRLDNLRITNAKGNSENRIKRKNRSYTNVYKVKNGKYVTDIYNSSIKYHKTHKTEEYAARDRDLQIIKQAPNSLYKKCFDDWNPEKIKEWEDELFLEDLFK